MKGIGKYCINIYRNREFERKRTPKIQSSLTQNAIRDILHGHSVKQPIVLQVVMVKYVDGSDTTMKAKLVLSDGEFTAIAILQTNVHESLVSAARSYSFGCIGKRNSAV